MNLIAWVVVGCIGLGDLQNLRTGTIGGASTAYTPPTEDELVESLPFSSTEQVLVVYDDAAKVEHLVLELRFDKANGAFGTLVPLPSAPSKVEKVARPPFDSLRGVFAYTPVVDIGMGRGILDSLANQGQGLGVGGAGLANGQSATPEPPPPPVEVLEEHAVGSFESTTLAVHDAGELGKWLTDHGLVAPKGVDAWAERYIRMGFSFLALKFARSADAGSGMTSETLRVTFPTPQAYFPYSEIVRSKQTKRLLAAWVIAGGSVRPVARQAQGSGWRIAQPWRAGERFTATHEELTSIFKDLADVMPTGDKVSVQTFRDWKTSREGWGDVVFVPTAATTFDEAAKSERRRILGLLDADLVPPPPPPVASAAPAVVVTDTPPPVSSATPAKDGCNSSGQAAGASSLLVVLGVLLARRRRLMTVAALAGAAGCAKKPPPELTAPPPSASASVVASASASAEPPVATLSNDERASHEVAAFAVLSGEAPDGGYEVIAGTAPIPPPPPTKRPGLAAVGEPNVQGSMDKMIVKRLLAQNRSRMTWCYQTGLRTNPSLEGTAQARFVILRDGSVGTAQVQFIDSEVSSCLASTVRSLSFPQPQGGIVIVTVPIALRPPS